MGALIAGIATWTAPTLSEASWSLSLGECGGFLRGCVVGGFRFGRRQEPGLGETIRVLDSDVLHAALGVVDVAGTRYGLSIVQYLLQRVEHEANVRRAGYAPIDDAPSVIQVCPRGMKTTRTRTYF